MDFVDRTLLRLADPAERAAALTPSAGDRLLAAAFVFHNVEVGTVTGVSVRDLELLPAAAHVEQLDAVLLNPVSGERWEASCTRLDAARSTSAHARMELMLTTETRRADTSIARVDTEDLEDLADVAAVDARIVADDGALPAAASALATRRFAALKTLLLERFEQPADVDVDMLLARKGIGDFPALLEAFSSPRHASRLELELVVDGTLPARIQTHRVVAAAIIDADPIARLSALIGEIQVGRAALERGTELASPPRGMTPRTGLPFVVLFPQAALADGDLPFPAGVNPAGAAQQRAARLTELQNRLTPFGIALAPIAA